MTSSADWTPEIPGDAEGVEPIAVIGLACRLPGAKDAAEFWRNLVDGVESARRLTDEELAAMADAGRADELADPNFVPVSAVLDDPEYFDAAFFGMSAREAETRDPQQRLFLELSYNALEDAGYEPGGYDGDIGVYAGSGEDAYQWLNTRRNRAAFAAVGTIGVAVSSHPDYVATLTSYKLNLRGPSITMHTACSTSLVAVHTACEALRNGECDMALTGGVNIDLPLGRGYVYADGGVYSTDGHCRAFDEKASGTVWASGGAVVVLKRLSDAVGDGDHIRAVVLGNAVNNDGSAKVGFTAPSQEGQAVVIAQALEMAQVDPRTISYVEAHGTGTKLGDPIEVAALSSAFRQYSQDVGWCAIGTVKTNIGHLGPAAGIAGVVKTVLALEHGLIPASLNYESPNPKIDFGSNPFYVNATLSRWDSPDSPRRACVSSFGMGGTNAHMVLEKAPSRPPRAGHDAGRPQLLQLSARTGNALEASAQRLSAHLAALAQQDEPGTELADVAYTLRAGRAQFAERMAVTASSLADAAEALGSRRRVTRGTAAASAPQVAFMFPGQGAQYAGMGAQLYGTAPTFRDAVDECCEIVAERTGEDLRALVLGTGADADERVQQTAFAQPALFIIEYALALLWRDLGVMPSAMVGHSIGEYVAAAQAGVFTLADALAVVVARGQLMQAMPAGAMIAVQLGEEELRKVVPEGLSIAAVNGPATCVVSGPAGLTEDFAQRLGELGARSRALRTSHAFHSPMIEPMLADFREVVAAVERRPPAMPFVSNVTGEWIADTDATDPSYWALHARQTVRFADCIATICRDGAPLLLECGPGQQLSGLARAGRKPGSLVTVASLPRQDQGTSEAEAFAAAAGKLWVSGVPANLLQAWPRGLRVPLPTYPWERKCFWVEPDTTPADGDITRPAALGARPVDSWYSVPVWRQLPAARRQPAGLSCLLLGDAAADRLGEALQQAGCNVIRVRSGDEFRRQDAGYLVRPAARDDYDALIADLTATHGLPARIVHAWALDPAAAEGPATGGGPAPAASPAQIWAAQDHGFFSLLMLVQALAGVEQHGEHHLDVVTIGTQDVTGGPVTRPEHATLAGITKVVPLELPWLSARQVDADPDASDGPAATWTIISELLAAPGADLIALRAGRRWERGHVGVEVPADPDGLPPGPGLRQRGVYLITGGLGGIGITVAEHLATRYQARLVLVSRSGLTADGPRARRATSSIGRMEQAGADVMVVSADVTSPEAMKRLRDQVTERFGPVNGIVHAAGIPGGGMAEVKEKAAAEAVLLPKVAGTLALHEAFADAGLDFVVLCSSATALAGGFGQVDYCAANNFLDAYPASRHGWRAKVISVNWGNWLDVGMAAEVSAPEAFRALQRGDVMTPIEHPMLTRRFEGNDEVVGWCSGPLSAGSHWVLDEHRIGGVPVLPGTAHLEAVRCAAAAFQPDACGTLELKDVVITQPLTVPDGSSAELRVEFSRGADGLEFQLMSIADGVARTHSSGSVAWIDDEEPRRVDLDALSARCPLEVDQSQPPASSSGLLSFGPRWCSLRTVRAGDREALATLEAAAAVGSELAEWPLHPALLDEALSFASTVSSPGADRYLPFGYGRVLIRSALPGRLYSHIRFHGTPGSAAEAVVADIAVCDDTGRELISVSDFTLRRLQDRLPRELQGQGRPAEAGAGRAGADGAAESGIAPAAGAEALDRLLAVDLGPRVAITAQSLDDIVAGVSGVTQETIEANLGARMVSAPAGDQADGDYVAPRNELEEVIAGVWAEVLGMERVSVTDDFFDLGGNSLIAVQIISAVRKKTGIRLPMRSLFEDPSVAGAAALAYKVRAGGVPE